MKKLMILALCLTSFIMLNGITLYLDWGLSEFFGQDVNSAYGISECFGLGVSHEFPFPYLTYLGQLEPGLRVRTAGATQKNVSPKIDFTYTLGYVEPYIRLKKNIWFGFSPFIGVGNILLTNAREDAKYKDQEHLNYSIINKEDYKGSNTTLMLGIEREFLDMLVVGFEYLRTLNSIKEDSDMYFQTFAISFGVKFSYLRSRM